jgi:hypothetical protein
MNPKMFLLILYLSHIMRKKESAGCITWTMTQGIPMFGVALKSTAKRKPTKMYGLRFEIVIAIRRPSTYLPYVWSVDLALLAGHCVRDSRCDTLYPQVYATVVRYGNSTGNGITIMNWEEKEFM